MRRQRMPKATLATLRHRILLLNYNLTDNAKRLVYINPVHSRKSWVHLKTVTPRAASQDMPHECVSFAEKATPTGFEPVLPP